MRKSAITLIALIFSVQFSASAEATSIYRCLGADGVVKFQDTPCRSDETGRMIELPDAPAVPSVDLPRFDAEKPATPPLSSQQGESTPVIESGPVAILCTRNDGSRYLTESGFGERRAVPLGMLGIPAESLAGAYAGRDGIGVSAPGLREPPVDRSPYGQLGGMYTWVEDPCVQINTAQLCGFLHGRIADAERRLRYAFSDTSAQVRQELEALRVRAMQCSR